MVLKYSNLLLLAATGVLIYCGPWLSTWCQGKPHPRLTPGYKWPPAILHKRVVWKLCHSTLVHFCTRPKSGQYILLFGIIFIFCSKHFWWKKTEVHVTQTVSDEHMFCTRCFAIILSATADVSVLSTRIWTAEGAGHLQMHRPLLSKPAPRWQQFK